MGKRHTSACIRIIGNHLDTGQPPPLTTLGAFKLEELKLDNLKLDTKSCESTLIFRCVSGVLRKKLLKLGKSFCSPLSTVVVSFALSWGSPLCGSKHVLFFLVKLCVFLLWLFGTSFRFFLLVAQVKRWNASTAASIRWLWMLTDREGGTACKSCKPSQRLPFHYISEKALTACLNQRGTWDWGSTKKSEVVKWWNDTTCRY